MTVMLTKRIFFPSPVDKLLLMKKLRQTTSKEFNFRNIAEGANLRERPRSDGKGEFELVSELGEGLDRRGWRQGKAESG